MKKFSLTIAAMMVLMVSTFAQHGNSNGYYQQSTSYVVYGGGYYNPYYTVTTGHHGNHHPNNYYNQNNNWNNSTSCNQDNCNDNNYVRPMSEREFECAKQSIASKGFDETRLIMAQQIVGSNRLLCYQVKQLMEVMSFESTRMSLAKYSWRHVMDKQNYYKLNDAFTFESSIYELNQYTSYN